ncbi:hypothetical protein O181_085734 [Austropuccinia psidii MF-1]|uniref:BolA protein n=1 Tax=Austropuccinia psidii MF-1 TaxID=1389203 RepID=A0A9Q3FVV4_9BASI|nr:hypothetical protein [Austropuccinia psidii MF-1]
MTFGSLGDFLAHSTPATPICACAPLAGIRLFNTTLHPISCVSLVRLQRMSSATEAAPLGPMESRMRQKLIEQLTPSRLEIVNESHLHSHHSAMRSIGGGSGETHFAVNLVSNSFIGKPTIARHRLVYQILDEELNQKGGIHALSLKTLTPNEDK